MFSAFHLWMRCTGKSVRILLSFDVCPQNATHPLLVVSYRYVHLISKYASSCKVVRIGVHYLGLVCVCVCVCVCECVEEGVERAYSKKSNLQRHHDRFAARTEHAILNFLHNLIDVIIHVKRNTLDQFRSILAWKNSDIPSQTIDPS